MQKSSWIVLGICTALIFCLGFAYLFSRSAPETLTRERAEQMVHTMQEAVRHKNVNTIMSYISPDPDTKVAGLDQAHIRRLLAGALHRMEDPRADVTNLAFNNNADEASLAFDLAVHNDGKNQEGIDYSGHVELQLRRIEVPHLFGLFHTREWRIVGGAQSGHDLTTWGDD